MLRVHCSIQLTTAYFSKITSLATHPRVQELEGVSYPTQQQNNFPFVGASLVQIKPFETQKHWANIN